MLKDFSQERFDILIQAGQSNSEGCGFGDIDTPYEPNERVWYLNGDGTFVWAAEIVVGNEIRSTSALSFAQEYVNSGLLKENRKLLILRTSVGGTGFLDGNWHLAGPFYLRMLEMTRTALALNSENRLAALLWHQGENDAMMNASYEVYHEHLTKLLLSVRESFHVPKLPFITGDLVPLWKSENADACRPIVDAIRAVCAECGYSGFAETDDLLSNYEELHRNTLGWEDHIHFSRKSLYTLGRRYFQAFSEIVRVAE